MDKDGNSHATGQDSWKDEGDYHEMEWEIHEGGMSVPHLQRVSPGGAWLASLDAPKRQLQLRSLAGDRSMKRGRKVALEGITGKIEELRWLSDGSGFVVMTDKNVFHVPYRTAKPSKRAHAHSVFHRPALAGSITFEDVRTLPTGLLVRTSEKSPEVRKGASHRELYLIKIADDTVQNIQRITPEGHDVKAANVRSDGRIVMSVNDRDNDKPSWELWTARIGILGSPVIVERRPCADMNRCDIVNWTPGTEHLGYALSNQTIVIDTTPNRAHAIREASLELSGGTGYGLDTLWMNRAENRVLAASGEALTVWDKAGNELWSWSAYDSDSSDGGIHSAKFDLDDESVLVAAGTAIYRVTEGEAEELFRLEAKDDDDDGWTQSFVDDVIPLKNGAIAYNVVQATFEEADDPDWSEEDFLDAYDDYDEDDEEPEAEEPAEPNAKTALR